MTVLIVLSIGIVAILLFALLHKNSTESVASESQPQAPQLLDLKTTTLAQRQNYYNRGYREQLRYDELQRRAEAAGDTATLEAIRLGTYTGPLPELEDEKPTPKIVLGGGDSDAPIQKLQYFCIKDKGYHVSVWPKDHYQPDIIEFDIAGMSYRENIDDYIGEFQGTLEAEPTNTYDPNAIKVLAPDGHHVGYVPKDMTSEIRRYASLPCPCYCYIGMNGTTFFSDCYILI